MLSLSEAPAKLIAQRFAPRAVSTNLPEAKKLSLKARIAALPWHGTQRGEKAMLSLSEAATAAGIAKSTIWRAIKACLLYTSPSPRDRQRSRMPSSA